MCHRLRDYNLSLGFEPKIPKCTVQTYPPSYGPQTNLARTIQFFDDRGSLQEPLSTPERKERLKISMSKCKHRFPISSAEKSKKTKAQIMNFCFFRCRLLRGASTWTLHTYLGRRWARLKTEEEVPFPGLQSRSKKSIRRNTNFLAPWKMKKKFHEGMMMAH